MPSFSHTASFEDAQVIDMTNLAIKVTIDGIPYWIPSSQIDDDSEVWQMGDEGTLILNEWIAKEKGLI